MIQHGIRIRLVFACAVALLATLACGDDDNPAAVDPNAVRRLGTIEVHGAGGSNDLYDSLTLSVMLTGPPSDIELLDILLSDGDHEQVHDEVLMDSTHPFFVNAVARLTDGVDGNLRFQYAAGGVTFDSTDPESEYIDFRVASAGPDFVGWEITLLRWTIVRASIKTPGSDPNDDEMWTDYDFAIDIMVEGRPAP